MLAPTEIPHATSADFAGKLGFVSRILEDVSPKAAKPGTTWDIVVLQAGYSKNRGSTGNRRYYPPETLQESLPLFEGARVFAYGLARGFFDPSGAPRADHKPDGVEKDQVNDLIGTLSGVRMGESRNAEGEMVPSIWARFTLFEAAEHARLLLREAWQRGMRDLFGFSQDVHGQETPRLLPGGEVVDAVTKISKVESVDLVSDPAAGGHFARLVESIRGGHTVKPIFNLLARLGKTAAADLTESSEAAALIGRLESLLDPAKIAEAMPTITVKEAADLREVLALLKKGDAEALEAAIMKVEAILANPEGYGMMPEAQPAPAAAPAPVKATESDAAKRLAEVERKLAASELRVSDERLTRRIEQCVDVPVALRESTRDALLGRPKTENEIEDAVRRMLNTTEKLKAEGHVKLSGATKITESDMLSVVEKFQIALHKAFHVRPDSSEETKWAGIPAFRGIKEAYQELTGDRDGQWRYNQAGMNKDFAQVHGREVKFKESVRIEGQPLRIRETVLSTTFPSLLGNTQHKRLLQDFRRETPNWRKIVRIDESMSDFKANSFHRIGGLVDLVPVLEGATYTEFLPNPAEDTITLTAVKRGRKLITTIEAIKNDDLRKLERMLELEGRSAARTLAKFVYNLLIGGDGVGGINNVAIYDTVVPYEVAGTHNNGVSGTLTWANGWAGITKMRKQREQNSLEPLAIVPKYLVVPPELEQVAYEITQSADRPDTANRATNTIRPFGIEPIVSQFLVSPLGANAYLVASPMESETITIAFLDNEQEPVVTVQDQRTEGLVFDEDKITSRIHHIYDGKMVDFRSHVAIGPFPLI